MASQITKNDNLKEELRVCVQKNERITKDLMACIQENQELETKCHSLNRQVEQVSETLELLESQAPVARSPRSPCCHRESTINNLDLDLSKSEITSQSPFQLNYKSSFLQEQQLQAENLELKQKLMKLQMVINE